MLKTETPEMIRALVEVARRIERNSEERLTLAALAETTGLSASRLQRAFKSHFGLSPKAYQDAVQHRLFKTALRRGDEVTDAIFSAGYGSVSRVYGESKRSLGMTPKQYQAGGQGETIHYALRNTTLGLLCMAATEKGVCFVEFGESEKSLVEALTAEFPQADLRLSPARQAPELDEWVSALDDYLAARSPRPDLPLDIRGTSFQQSVWTFLVNSREGKVMTYSEVAEGIGRPKAVRAVASACGKNRIGILVPCHRVLRGDGGLGGFRWGLERKKALLAAERPKT